jgi:hypothetical protein
MTKVSDVKMPNGTVRETNFSGTKFQKWAKGMAAWLSTNATHVEENMDAATLAMGKYVNVKQTSDTFVIRLLIS